MAYVNPISQNGFFFDRIIWTKFKTVNLTVAIYPSSKHMLKVNSFLY